MFDNRERVGIMCWRELGLGTGNSLNFGDDTVYCNYRLLNNGPLVLDYMSATATSVKN